jgi:N6-adenosine-specific RNA methylase IME4
VPKLVLNVGMGRYTRGCTEQLMLATRGRCTPLVKAKNIPNVIVAPRREHSEKPEESYRLIEAVAPGPYLELFARRKRSGWSCHGNEIV